MIENPTQGFHAPGVPDPVPVPRALLEVLIAGARCGAAALSLTDRLTGRPCTAAADLTREAAAAEALLAKELSDVCEMD